MQQWWSGGSSFLWESGPWACTRSAGCVTSRPGRSVPRTRRRPGGGARATTGTGADAARDLGLGWKISPSVDIEAGAERELAAISGSGYDHAHLVDHPRDHWRTLMLAGLLGRSDEPAVEVPLGDFFCQGWGRFAQVSLGHDRGQPQRRVQLATGRCRSRTSARITLENLGAEPTARCTTRSTYELGADYELGYLHAQFRRSNPLPQGDTHPILDGIEGHGHYVGTYLAWGVNTPDGGARARSSSISTATSDFPTIAGTGTEDYFGGAWNFDVPGRLHRAQYALPRDAAGAAPRRAVREPAAFRALPLACARTRSTSPGICGSISRRSAGGRAGATACAATTSPRRLVLPGPARRRPARPAVR